MIKKSLLSSSLNKIKINSTDAPQTNKNLLVWGKKYVNLENELDLQDVEYSIGSVYVLSSIL